MRLKFMRILSSGEKNIGRSRAGSVLILVIVLLLLLAILGAAFISASRGDREVSGQLALNKQADVYAKSIGNMVSGMIINDLADFSGFIHGQIKTDLPVSPPQQSFTTPNFPN